MKVCSVNIGEKKTLPWSNKQVTTGIFKYPAEEIYLGNSDVVNDNVVDRKYHGGKDKACYIYSADYYSYWKELYPDLEWNYGMFGENITVEGLSEDNIHIGDVFELGEAIVQISEPRQPCFKLNLRFNSQKMIKQFIEFEHCGAYLRVLKEGKVKPGDSFVLKEQSSDEISVLEVYQILYKRMNDETLVQRILESTEQTETIKEEIRRIWSF